jgi:hypothetical protein
LRDARSASGASDAKQCTKEMVMSKDRQRGNKEVKKPKKPPAHPVPPVLPSAIAADARDRKLK